MATSRFPLVVVLGATGAGKSKLAIEIAKIFKGEIISADSMQIYKGLDIITNKVTPEEQQECPHHLISYLEADHAHYNIVDFRDAALPIIDDLLSKRILPIVVGGTNYYIESVLWNFLIDKKHSPNGNTKSDKVPKISIPQPSNYSRRQQNDPSRISETHDGGRPSMQPGVDPPLVRSTAGKTATERLDTHEILTIAGFPKTAGCLQYTAGLHQPLSSLSSGQTSCPDQLLQSCGSNSQTLCNGSSRVVLESLTSTSSIHCPVQFLQSNVASFSNNGAAQESSNPDNTQSLEAFTTHSLHSFSAASVDTSSPKYSCGTAIDEDARNSDKVSTVIDAFTEDSSVQRVDGSICDIALCVEPASCSCKLSCDVSSSSGLARQLSDNPGLLCQTSSNRGLSCDISSGINLSLLDSQRASDCGRGPSDAHGLPSGASGLPENSLNRELSQENEINVAAQNPQDFAHDSNALLRCLNGMNSLDLYSHLQTIDPETALRMHPNNRRKIIRAIHVYYECEQTMSSLLSEQHNGQENVKSGPLRYPNPCILWVKCQQPDLNARLDGRVDEMMARGLVAELEHFHKEVSRLESLKRNDSTLDTGHTYTHGILQMIGFKEFHDYLQLSAEDRASDSGQKLLQQGVSDLKLATRRYARQQVRWITNRFCNRPGTNVPPIYAVDSTDLTQWDKAVEEAIEVVKAYIAGEVPSKAPEMVVPKVGTQLERNVCDLCGGRIFLQSHEWADHLKSKKHKSNVKMLVVQRRQLLELLSAREEQLKEMADETLNTSGGSSEGSSLEDSLNNMFL